MTRDSIEGILGASLVSTIGGVADITCELLDPDRGIHRAISLTPPRALDSEQRGKFVSVLLDPRSWFFCVKRCLPRDTALFRLLGEGNEVTVLVDTCCGWTVSTAGERHGAFFDPVQRRVQALLKSLFPEYASPSARSMWRAGAIKELQKRISSK